MNVSIAPEFLRHSFSTVRSRIRRSRIYIYVYQVINRLILCFCLNRIRESQFICGTKCIYVLPILGRL